jgi:hypothetical protein
MKEISRRNVNKWSDVFFSLANEKGTLAVYPPDCSSLLISGLLLCCCHDVDSSDLESHVHIDVVTSVNDDQYVGVPFAILRRMIHFGDCDKKSFDSISRFCVQYDNAHGSKSLWIFRTVIPSE